MIVVFWARVRIIFVYSVFLFWGVVIFEEWIFMILVSGILDYGMLELEGFSGFFGLNFYFLDEEFVI